jgi:hypothetical protein
MILVHEYARTGSSSLLAVGIASIESGNIRAGTLAMTVRDQTRRTW